MNVAELVGSRAGELAAFSTLLFRSHRRGSDNNNNSNNNSNGLGNVRLVKSHAEDYNFPRRLTVSQYRRPSSPNVPFRSVRRYALKRARRGTPVMNVKRKTPRKRLLTYAQWCLLLKRGRRFALRRRRTACSRTKRRAWALRHGKHQQPLCACAMPAPDAVARPLFTAGKRISVVWLPSHWLLRRRFHYTVAKISVQTCPRQYYSDNATITGSGCSSPPVASVRIAVPARSQRKQHRVLQRWVARLPSPAALPVGMRSPRRRTSKVTAVPPPACLLADRSHVCVWFIRPRSAEKRFSAEELMDLLIMRTANTPSEQCYTKAFSPGKASLHSPGDMWKPNCCDAYYGYMWCAAEGGGCSSLKGYNKLVSSSPTTVGVVTPVIMLCVCGKDGESVGNCYLISSSVVRFGARAQRHLNCCLISFWNPCPAVEALSSVFEVWCCAGAVGSNGGELSPAVQWTQQRVDEAVLMWGSATPSKRGVEDISCNKEDWNLQPSAGVEVFVFPSLSTRGEVVDGYTFPIHRCVLTVLVVSLCPVSSVEPLSEATCCDVWPQRRCHFQLSRRIFAFLASLSTAPWSRQSSTQRKVVDALCHCKRSGYTYSVRKIAEEERKTLLLLSGCHTTWSESSRKAVSQREHVMPLCYSPSNAHQYVLLKFEKSAGREHQKKGSALLLLTLKALQQADAVCGAALPELAHVGVLSTVPFFSMRFGCRLAYAWVWDSAAWKSLSEGWRNNTLLACMNVGEEMTENSAVEARANKAGRCCFFVCAKDQVPAFSPYLSGPPEHSLAHVGPHRVCKRGRPSTMNSGKTWKEMELALYDINMCAPVELVRLSAPKAS